MQKTEIICISCPVGCSMDVSTKNGEIHVSGNKCNAGISYAKEELTNPTRNIATSVKVIGGESSRLSVKTAKPIPKNAIKEVVRAIHKITVTAPVCVGDVVLVDAAGTGVDILATRNIKKH